MVGGQPLMSSQPERVQILELEKLLEEAIGPRPAPGARARRQLELLEVPRAPRRARRPFKRRRRKARKTRAAQKLERVAAGSLPARPVRKSEGQWAYLLRTILEDIRDARAPRSSQKLSEWIQARGDVLRRAELNASHLLKTLELET